MKRKLFLGILAAGLILFFQSPGAAVAKARSAGQAAAPSVGKEKPIGILSLCVENDIFTGLDSGYTSGVKLVWISPPAGSGPGRMRLPRWLDALSCAFPPFRTPGADRFVSLSLGHIVYTPDDLTRKDLIVDDRPYAGFLYASLGFHAKHETSLDTVEILAGVVGPVSLAGDFQRLLHRTFGWTRPKGWAHQIKNEPVLGIAYDHKWKIRRPTPERCWSWDTIAHAGAGLSNARTGANAGIEFRLGLNIADDFGAPIILPGSDSAALFEGRSPRLSAPVPFGIHLFAMFQGHGVLRDIFLDGNTFRDSHRVDKRPFTADVAAGLAFRSRRLKFSFSYVYQTRQFKTQKRNHVFGSFNISLALRQ